MKRGQKTSLILEKKTSQFIASYGKASELEGNASDVQSLAIAPTPSAPAN